jgi:hypothetical protein
MWTTACQPAQQTQLQHLLLSAHLRVAPAPSEVRCIPQATLQNPTASFLFTASALARMTQWQFHCILCQDVLSDESGPCPSAKLISVSCVTLM